ncbi:hypothetical protein CC80DRAFT_558925 [Byssothecium circinans]|uniref:Heterokaryon incompatibility domain-containing protein n=1 Tax=Byssothecium circinans TaxID=147558 RepID=A0A6A5U583_9PLEO|nr:hypothetical protein CC80DRAFT_558925 [Byssothecium circinans]
MTSLTTSCLYTYTNVPLGENRDCTRLLTLHSGEFDDTLCCSLRAADIHHDKDYEAVSYTWGDTQDTSLILLNDKNFQATKSLIVVLRHLRLPNKDRVLWVDAICINQVDDNEKSRQVQRMGQIYANARVVLIWLGEAV